VELFIRDNPVSVVIVLPEEIDVVVGILGSI
jgi:hypothetical protein